MKNKQIIAFIFIFSLFFTNLIPYTTQISQISGSYNNEIMQLINLLNVNNITQYFTVFFNAFILFITLRFLINKGCNEYLRVFFTFGFVGLVLINLGTQYLTSNVFQNNPYGSNELIKVYESVINVIQWLHIGLILFSGITLVLILLDIKYSLKHDLALIFTTIISTFGLVAPLIAIAIMKEIKVGISFELFYGMNIWLSLLSILSVIIFKVFVINEVIHHATKEEFTA